MLKPRLSIRTTVKCVDCGFFGFREGGVSEDGNGTFIGNKFWECHASRRKDPDFSESYITFSEDGTDWNVIGCFHRVWELWGSHSKPEKEQAKKLLTEARHCKYFYPYISGYEPAGHNEMVRDTKNRETWLYVGLINAGAVILAALITVLIMVLIGSK